MQAERSTAVDFWNDLSKTIYTAADQTVKETEKLTGIAKVKYKLSVLRSKLDLCYRSIGELKYAEHRGEAVPDASYTGLFSQADKLNAEKKALEKQLDALRDCITCPLCGCRVQRGMSFCPKCGEKLNQDQK